MHYEVDDTIREDASYDDYFQEYERRKRTRETLNLYHTKLMRDVECSGRKEAA